MVPCDSITFHSTHVHVSSTTFHSTHVHDAIHDSFIAHMCMCHPQRFIAHMCMMQYMIHRHIVTQTGIRRNVSIPYGPIDLSQRRRRKKSFFNFLWFFWPKMSVPAYQTILWVIIALKSKQKSKNSKNVITYVVKSVQSVSLTLWTVFTTYVMTFLLFSDFCFDFKAIFTHKIVWYAGTDIFGQKNHQNLKKPFFSSSSLGQLLSMDYSCSSLPVSIVPNEDVPNALYMHP